MSIIATLLSPFDYFRIKHPLKKVVDRWSICAPLFASTVVLYFWPSLDVFGTSGLIAGINSLLSILTGFFITSLAAIATFSGTVYHIDDQLEGEAATLHGDALTRRQFLCHLFAYVAILSLTLYLLGVIGLTSAGSHLSNAILFHRWIIKSVFVVIYISSLGHVVGTTMIGLVFLSSRLSRVSARDRFKILPDRKNSVLIQKDPLE